MPGPRKTWPLTACTQETPAFEHNHLSREAEEAFWDAVETEEERRVYRERKNDTRISLAELKARLGHE